MLVKICGITRRKDAEAAIAAGADLVGFVLVPGSRRAVDPREAGWIVGLTGAEKVGVFRDAPLDEVLELRERLALDRVQLHGDEPEQALIALGSTTIRRVRPVTGAVWDQVARLSARCLPLLDPGAGDGVSWPWSALGAPPPGVRFGLAGGLTPENVAEAIAALRPELVDCSSGVERAPGVKDSQRMAAFVRAARGAIEAGPAPRIR